MYYGKSDAVSDWDGGETFIQYHGAASAAFLDSAVIPATQVCFEIKARLTNTVGNIHFGLSNNTNRDLADLMAITLKTSTNVVGHTCRNNGVETYISESETVVVDQWYRGKTYTTGSISKGYWDDDEIVSGITTNLPNQSMGLWVAIFGGTGEQEWSFARKYAANPPTYEFGSEESEPSTGNPFWYYAMLKRRN